MLNKIFKKVDPTLTIVIFVISTIGLAVNYSLTFSLTNPELGAGSFPKQVAFIIFGFVLYLIISRLDIIWLKQKLVIIFLIVLNVVLLLATLKFAPVIAGVKRWFLIGNIQIQISEIAKLILIITNSYFLSHFFETKFFSKIKSRLDIFKNVGILIILNLLCFILIALEPSLGIASLILLSQIFVILYFWPYKKELIFFTLIVCILSFVIFKIQVLIGDPAKLLIAILVIIFVILLLFMFLKVSKTIFLVSIVVGLILLPSLNFGYENLVTQYQKDRIATFLNQTTQQKDANYQQDQAKIAIQNGGVFGLGYLQGTQTKSENGIPNLPYAYTDFAYAGFSEEFGIFGGLILMFLFLGLIVQILQIGSSIENNFFSILIFGVATTLSFQIVMHIAINLGLIVNTGIPLPLISYGGSINLIYFVMFGIVNSIRNTNKFTSFEK